MCYTAIGNRITAGWRSRAAPDEGVRDDVRKAQMDICRSGARKRSGEGPYRLLISDAVKPVRILVMDHKVSVIWV